MIGEYTVSQDTETFFSFFSLKMIWRYYVYTVYLLSFLGITAAVYYKGKSQMVSIVNRVCINLNPVYRKSF